MAATDANAPAAAPVQEEHAAPKRRAPWWIRLLRDPAAALAIGAFVLIALAAVLAPLLAPFDPALSSRNVMIPPMWSDMGMAEHPLGTDGLGRDILSRLLYGTQITLLIGLFSLILGGTLGSLLGLFSAYNAKVDPWIMRLVDMMLSFPAILLGLALVAAMGQGVTPVIIALGIATIPDFARISRGIAVGVMKQEFMEAGRALGLSHRALFTTYLLRNCISSIMIFMSLRFGQLILQGAALSFLGLGARPPLAELGMMAAQGRDFLLFAPHIAVLPSLLIFLIVLCANVAGDALRDVLDPRLRS
jgi:ABC-type dipeptide/oligopeptide/nickel transport system permease subunit